MLTRIIRPALSAAAALVLSAAAAAPAFAQQQPPTEFQSWRVPGWTFTPGIVVGALYDTNVTVSGPDVNNNTPTDTMLQLQPSGQLAYLSPRTTFSSGYQGSLRHYFDLGSLDGTDHRGYLSLRERVSRRVTIFANDNYQQVPTTDLLEISGGVPFRRTGAKHNSLNGGIEARLTKSTDGVIRYENTWVDFVRKDTLLTGGMVQAIGGELTHRFSDRASAGGQYGVRWADLNEGTRQLGFQDAGGVFRYRTGPQTTFEAGAGIAHLIDRNTRVTHTGPYARLGVTHHTARTSFGVDFNRSYVPSLSFGGSNQSQELRGYIRMPLDRNRFYVQESASWRRTDPFVKTELALDSMFLHTVFGYAVQKWFRVEGYHAFTNQDNKVAGGKISRHMVGAQFVVSEPVRIR
jgi:hypothetical protein